MVFQGRGLMQNKRNSSGNLFQEGIDYLNRGLLAEADESFLGAAASVFSLLGAVAFRRGDYPAALEWAREIRRKAPHDPMGYLAPVYVYEAMNAPEKGVRWAWKALDLKFDLKEAHSFLARFYLPGPSYHEVLKFIHHYLKPANYLEIGVAGGDSIGFVLPETRGVGIDPSPYAGKPLGSNVTICQMISDEYFASGRISEDLGGRPIDLGFIDGMHLFEYALRDFINIEKHGSDKTVVLVHDCYPLDEITSLRDRITAFWAGDVWKVILCLKKYRPDLEVNVVKTFPTGLGVITGLDPSSTLLADNLDGIIREYENQEFSAVARSKERKLNGVENNFDMVRKLIDRRIA